MVTSPFDSIKFWLFFAGYWLAWAVLQGFLLRWFGLDPIMAILDSNITNGFLALACLAIISNLRYYRPDRNRYLYIGGWCLLLTIVWLVLIHWLITAIMEMEGTNSDFFIKSMPVRFLIGFLMIGWSALLSFIWYSQQDQKENESRKADAEKLSKEAELFKLRQQLQPHFLFNSLNSINALIGSKPQEARKMIQQLSDFLRGTLKKEDHLWVPLQEELQHLQLYLEIEKVRFGHRLSTTITCDEITGSVLVPPMLLQPIVENAIKFGLYDTIDSVSITLNAQVTGNMLEVEVKNPFDSQTTAPRHGAGFGLNGIRRRLYLVFGRHDLLTTNPDKNTFTTLVKIPLLP